MPRKKKETILEKAEETVKEIVEGIENVGEKIGEEVKEIAEDLGLKKKKTTKKKSDAEDSTTDKTKEDKLAKLKAKAEKLAKGIKTDETDLKKKVKADSEEKQDGLVPIEDYLKSSIHLGTRAITPDMRPYVYKRRADSLAVFNTALLDDKIKENAEFLSQYEPNEIIVVCKREAGEKAVKLFSQVTGIKAFIKNYPAGILTNPNLKNFIETEMVLICDPWTDKSALLDAKKIKVPVLAICDTNNYTMNVNKILPGNNKSAKSLGMIFYLLAKIYVEKRKLKTKVPQISEWIDGWDTLVPPK